MITTLPTTSGDLRLPAFLPDGTRGVVRTVDGADLEACGVRAVMVNTLHLASHPGLSVIGAVGGVRSFMGFNGPVATDSGGFQVYSLIDAGLASVSSHGFTYRTSAESKREKLTPESCIHKQLKTGSDILFCLDHCTHPDAASAVQRESVDNTVRWARVCRDVFDRLTADRETRPLLYAVVQGGEDRGLRRECVERLGEMGFDGYGFGGWPINAQGGLVDMVAAVAEMLPPATALHGLGIGKPENLVKAYDVGYRTFDCVLPTRDARHKRLYLFSGDPAALDLRADGFYRTLYLDKAGSMRDSQPIEEGCDCPTCRRFSRAYLHHLNRIRDPLVMRLATLHNLRFYTRLVEELGRRTAASGDAR